MSEEKAIKENVEKAKVALQGLNWWYIVVVLSLVGLGVFFLWWMLKRSSKNKKKGDQHAS